MICLHLSVSLSNSRMFILNNFMCVKPKIIEHFYYLKSIFFSEPAGGLTRTPRKFGLHQQDWKRAGSEIRAPRQSPGHGEESGGAQLQVEPCVLRDQLPSRQARASYRANQAISG